MVKIILLFFVYLFAMFGLVSLITGLLSRVGSRVKLKNTNIRMAIIVKDQEEVIEGVIRNIFAGGFLEKMLIDQNLIVVDMGSKDKTVDILSRLKRDYEYMDILETDQKQKLFNIFSEQQN